MPRLKLTIGARVRMEPAIIKATPLGCSAPRRSCALT